jgi:hypothetical protein
MIGAEIDAFVSGWIDAWNRRDIEAALAHFSDDVTFTSPVAAAVTGNATVHGKDAIRAYWTAALQRMSALVFTLDRALWGPERRELAIVYERNADGKRSRVCEMLAFDEDGMVVRGEVMRGAELTDPLTL